MNILHIDQEQLSRRFATTRIENKFEGVEYSLTALRLPIFKNVARLPGVHHGEHAPGG